MRYPIVLTIAGSDSVGGAGIQADIKAISATGSYAASAITAVTVQNTVGVRAVSPVPVDIVKGQIDAVLSDIGADAVKIGMLHSSELIIGIKEMLVKYSVHNIVLDPVMVSTSGHRLIEESAVDTLVSELIPMASVITPNIPEAEILAGHKIQLSAGCGMMYEDAQVQALREMAVELSERFSTASHKVSVLMKAGHIALDAQDRKSGSDSAKGASSVSAEIAESSESDFLNGVMLLTDIFYNAVVEKSIELPSQCIKTNNTHGTGCTLSSAFASYLAQGLSLDMAARKAKEYIANAIASGAKYRIGHGHGPVDHFWNLH